MRQGVYFVNCICHGSRAHTPVICGLIAGARDQEEVHEPERKIRVSGSVLLVIGFPLHFAELYFFIHQRGILILKNIQDVGNRAK